MQCDVDRSEAIGAGFADGTPRVSAVDLQSGFLVHRGRCDA
jgi:hypothetical protein